jgi:hypothetical protein
MVDSKVKGAFGSTLDSKSNKASEAEKIINDSETKSIDGSIQREMSRTFLNNSNVGAQSAKKLTG